MGIFNIRNKSLTILWPSATGAYPSNALGEIAAHSVALLHYRRREEINGTMMVKFMDRAGWFAILEKRPVLNTRLRCFL